MGCGCVDFEVLEGWVTTCNHVRFCDGICVRVKEGFV